MRDPNWNANLSVNNSEPDDDLGGDEVKVKKKLYVVPEDKLLSLFKIGQKCGHKGAEATVASFHGTLVTIAQQCFSCEEPTKWSSQDIVNGYPCGNITLSAALLSSGNVPSNALRMLNHWGVQGIVRGYSLHDTKTNTIICTERVVSTEPDTKKSAAMEVLGLSRALGVVDDYCPHLEIKLITDGHAGVSKYVGENPHPDKVTHYLDIWHG
ncbi:uncharacterized protein LOC135499960 isoform X2 [Lineus longissimus]|uniref:uncharacterized protein LOC135499960 isoform X2 n=1 Tax=Lineus longissimus TaxID=88925 RepID=UPI00315D10F4